MTNRPEILVGVDGSPSSRAAVAWAVAEAALSDRGLLLVHGSDAAAYGLWTTTRSIRQGLRELAQPIVDEAVAQARLLDSTVPVRGRVVLGSPSRVLLQLATGVELVVVGRQGRGAVAARLLGSVSQRMLAHAGVPVVAVGQHVDRSVARVVVGLADGPTAFPALEFGIGEALRHRVPLRVVRAWHVPMAPRAPEFVESPVPDVEIATEMRWVESRLADVPSLRAVADVESVVRAGWPAAVLRDFCSPDDLLVLGHHRRAPFSPPGIGSVIAGTLHHTECAVAVVGTPVDDAALRPDGRPDAQRAAGQRAGSGTIATGHAE